MAQSDLIDGLVPVTAAALLSHCTKIGCSKSAAIGQKFASPVLDRALRTMSNVPSFALVMRSCKLQNWRRATDGGSLIFAYSKLR